MFYHIPNNIIIVVIQRNRYHSLMNKVLSHEHAKKTKKPLVLHVPPLIDIPIDIKACNIIHSLGLF